MQPEQIMSSDLLDILFADRNKSYGAYALRREYSRRLQKSLLITGALVCMALAFYYYQGNSATDVGKPIIIDLLPPIPTAIPEPKAPTPPPAPKPKQPVATVRDVVPVIVKDNVKPDPPPSIDELINPQPGLETTAGIPAEGFPPPVVSGTGTATAPPPAAEPDNAIREKVDIESSYPGGLNAWKRFLIKTFRYPSEAEQNRVAGTVLIKFVVDKNGKVSDIQALSGPDELRAEAIRVIGRSGKWIPAMKNDSVVNSYKYQQIVFQLSE
jgi:protein TonB